MVHQCALDFHGADAVPRDVEHVVDAAQNPEVAFVITLRAVTGEIDVLPLAPINLGVPLVVAPDRAQHAGPRLGNGEIAAADLPLVALAIPKPWPGMLRTIWGDDER